MQTYSPEIKKQALKFSHGGVHLKEIAKIMKIPERTLAYWGLQRNGDPKASVEANMEARLKLLSWKEKKTENDFQEMGRLTDNLVKLRKAANKPTTPKDDRASASSKATAGYPARRGRKPKNDISHIDPDDPRFFEDLYPFQKRWMMEEKRFDLKLKSRQIGASRTFARKGFHRAIKKGHNQIFFSASRNQVAVTRDYIKDFASDKFGVELEGVDKIKLSNKAQLIFTSTNVSTAQSFSGDLWGDEITYIPKWNAFYRVSSGMATQSRFTKTFFSTPSFVGHDSYDLFQKEGKFAPEVFTIHDAIAQGFDLVDLEQIKEEYSEDDFANLFLCRWIDDALSAFTLESLEDCQKQAGKWQRIDREPVWIGYDPSRKGRDEACVAVIAPPLVTGGKFRVIEIRRWKNKAFSWQAEQIHDYTRQYNVQQIGIDITGIGYGVFEHVQKFFPMVTPIQYTIDVKTGLVLKAKDVIDNRRLAYCIDDPEITRAFLMIKQTSTDGGRITYKATRSQRTGHADVAWAVMHGLQFETLTPHSSSIEIFN